MNVDKLQKINALANEFKKHNFAGSNEDAYKQAESVYDPSKKPQKTEDEKAARSTRMDGGMIEKKVEYMLEMHNKRMQEEMTVLRSAINTLNAEIKELKAQPRQPATPPQEKKPVQQALKTEEKTSHPKRGEFTSSDVDIQKMFYFGTKR